MFFAPYYLDCLSQASYLIADEGTGRAVVVDPRRDVSEYLADARAHGLTVVGVINTHFHADFVAGHLELADSTGAWIGYGSRAETEYPIRPLSEGERIVLGDVVLEIMETPGHTPESISVLVYEHAGDTVPHGVL
ncbi:MBL fold metallo-hydrolase, partial [Streptomyces sp. SID6041]|nr:MBL fold metallo-hydrolase [Streptomyces sp. SID6041]